MAISQMSKVMIVTHRSQSAQLLESVQQAGICQLLDAEQSYITKQYPELCCRKGSEKQTEDLLSNLNQVIDFLKQYIPPQKGIVNALAPRSVVDNTFYKKVTSDKSIFERVEQALDCRRKIEELEGEIENITGRLKSLAPWKKLDTPVEQLGDLKNAHCFVGFLPDKNFDQAQQQLEEHKAGLEIVNNITGSTACVIVCLNESVGEVQKLLRSVDFEQISFEDMTGTVKENIDCLEEKLKTAKKELVDYKAQAKEWAKQLLDFQVLADHLSNLLERQTTESTAPGTDQTEIYEGWVRQKDYSKLEKIVSKFDASSLSTIEPGEDEDPPVEIENKRGIKPFEVITRLYGMPRHIEVDPTALLAAFFAIFFALCLTDAGYGLVIIALMMWFIKKMQGDTKFLWLMIICSIFTVVAGALTGGWFGDAVQQFIPALNPLRQKMMWFDPLEKPMMFFYIALGLGYFQIIFGLFVAFVHNLKRREYVAAVCDNLTWLVMLNSLLMYGFAQGGVLSPQTGTFFGYLAIVPAAGIFLFSERNEGLGGCLGMGAFNLFSTIFYLGDVLSYLRLMALGMVTAGLGMAINVIGKITLDIPYIGFIVMIAVLLGGHIFNLAISGLSAFVHTLRLQYVEFFPKFMIGGGKDFEPLKKEYKHIYIKS
jgi:V/A-type H+-transporting ATPase subunit I